MKYIRTKYEGILETQTTSKCIYAIRNKNVNDKNCYVTYLWDNWRNYHLIDFQNCVLFSYNSAQNFISDLMRENLNYQDLVIEISPYYKNCKQADTIEELCDEFCYIKNGVVSQYLTIDFKFKRDDEFCALRNKLTANGIAEVSKGISKYELENGELKFAIWTSKGLIYVAKMNENGELELI